MAENASSLAWSMWAGAFEAAGLDVDVPERSATELDVPLGSIGQFVDEDTGATVFVSLDEVRREDGEADEDDVERGLGAAAVNVGLRLGGGRLLRVLGRKAGGAAARRWEAACRPEQIRWFRTADRGRGEASVMQVDDLTTLREGRSLLWLHDALGRSEADFSGLDADLHGELCERYQGRVWAYDHPTLHLDPSENAGRLMGELIALGQPIDVDVVGFGRGGLVARAMAEQVRDRPVRVGSLVTVGTPHLGTPLADANGVLAWVNRLTNLAVLAPDPVSDLVGALAAVLAHAVEGTVDALVGFTAMGRGAAPSADVGVERPDDLVEPSSQGASRSLFVGGQHRVDADDGTWRAIKRWAANTLLDDRENDLFVPLDSALGRRDGDAVVAGGPAVGLAVFSTHGSYFGNLEVERALRGWLLDGHALPAESTIPHPHPDPSLPAAVAEGRLVVQPPTGETAAPSRVARPARQASTSTFPTLHVRLLHASLEHAQYPVLVGHFAGSPLSGAEERLDDCLENRLSRAQVARDYPEALGEFRHFPGYEGTPPPGAIVVGLGPVGDLTESQLTSVVTRSLVRYASEQRDRERASVSTRPGGTERGDNELGVASVLIGTSRSSGLSVEGSVRAIVAGVVAANLRLAQAVRPAGGQEDDPRAPVFAELRFVARHEDMVELAARALDQLRAEKDRRPGAYPIHLHVQPDSGEGAAGPNPPDDSANDVWARLRIESTGLRADGLGELTYAVMARSARADEVAHPIDPNIIDDLIAKSINRRSDPRIGATLYELLVPHELKQPLGSGSHLHLLLDEHTADHPWELLTPRGDAFREARPVALGGGLLRQFLETGDRRQAPERAPERTVLVIGNPPPGPGFSSLAGAAREAQEVVETFAAAPGSRSWQITARIWDSRERYLRTELDEPMATDPAENIVNELMTGSWRVVHIAAHGSFDPGGNAALSGVVLGPGRRLAAATLGQLAIVPDLVVLNACHLGAINRQLAGMNRVAASLARQLMQIGVRAVIAAGWAVGDIAAAEFAKELYSSLLDGRELGDAVLSARVHVHDYLPSTVTWGAYQCYGDPGFRLAPRRQRSATAGSGFLTVSELRRGIRAAASVVSDRTSSLSALRRGIEAVTLLAAEGPEDDEDLVRELELLEGDDLFTSARPEVQANIAADLAVAWAELGDFSRAAGHYRFAIEHGGNDVPLIAVEQLVSMSVRLARQSSDSTEQQRLFDDARQLLRALDRLGPTGERMALWGSYHKKRACTSSPPDYLLVAQAARRYRRALELDGDRPKAYHELNARQLTAIVWRVERDRGMTLLDPPAMTPRSDTTSVASGRRSPASDFWSRSELGDRLLTSLVERAVREQPSDETVVDLKAAYVNAFRLRSSAANRRSVIEHLEDVATLLPVDLELQRQLSAVAAELRDAWLPSAIASTPSAVVGSPNADPAPIAPR